MNSVSENLLCFFKNNFPNALKYDKDSYFSDTRVISSLEMIRLILEIEKFFNIKVPDNDISEENFGSINNIENYLKKQTLIT